VSVEKVQAFQRGLPVGRAVAHAGVYGHGCAASHRAVLGQWPRNWRFSHVREKSPPTMKRFSVCSN
jgi:hypothetical protein